MKMETELAFNCCSKKDSDRRAGMAEKLQINQKGLKKETTKQ